MALANFNPSPSAAFLNGVKDPLVKAWPGIVYRCWTRPIKDINDSALCKGATRESTLIPLSHAFIDPSGCFREICEYLYPTTRDTIYTYDSQATGILSGSSKALSSLKSTTSSKPPPEPTAVVRVHPKRWTYRLPVPVLTASTRSHARLIHQHDNNTSTLERSVPLADLELE